jgi:hypothetical protein
VQVGTSKTTGFKISLQAAVHFGALANGTQQTKQNSAKFKNFRVVTKTSRETQ